MRAMPTPMSMNRISGIIIPRQGWVDGFLLLQERQSRYVSVTYARDACATNSRVVGLKTRPDGYIPYETRNNRKYLSGKFPKTGQIKTATVCKARRDRSFGKRGYFSSPAFLSTSAVCCWNWVEISKLYLPLTVSISSLALLSSSSSPPTPT